MSTRVFRSCEKRQELVLRSRVNESGQLLEDAEIASGHPPACQSGAIQVAITAFVVLFCPGPRKAELQKTA